MFKNLICKNCGSKKIKKIISVVGGFKFIGEGFYENDYKGKNKW